MAPSQPEWTVGDFIHPGYWWSNRGILVLNLWLILPLMTSTVNGLDSSLVNGLQILPDWQDFFKHPEGKELGLINSAQFLGTLLGLPFSPFASDILGRRATLFIGSTVMLGGVAVQASARSVTMFIIARAILGFGLIFCQNAAPLLLIELSYPTHRGKITSLFNSSWYLGSIISAWVCFGAYAHAQGSEWSWRVPSMIQALFPLLQISLVWFMPESPRWLVSKGLEGQAARILAKYHASGGDERDPLVVFELAQIRHAIRLEEEINRSTSFKSLFTTEGNRKRMRIIIAIAMFSQWSGNGLVSYYINLVLEGVGFTDTETKAAINGGLQIFNYLIAVGAAMLVDWMGRRLLFLISNCGMLVSFACWTITTALYNTRQNTAAAKATIPLIFIFYFFYDVAYTPMLVAYTLEILPYRIRAKGFAIMNLTVFLTAAFNQFVNPWAIDAIGWWYYLAYCIWLIAELIFVITFIVETRGLIFYPTYSKPDTDCDPSTRECFLDSLRTYRIIGRTLEETAAMFDGDQPPQDLAAMGGDAATMTMDAHRHVAFYQHQPEPSGSSQSHSQKEAFEFRELHSRHRHRNADEEEARMTVTI